MGANLKVRKFITTIDTYISCWVYSTV